MSNTLHHRQSMISQYIHAKDNNKPFLMQKAFLENAVLEMKVNTKAISFPAKTIGVEWITKILVREFCEEYENVYTFCLTDSVKEQENKLSCQWLVGMTERRTGKIKVGCGLYDWSFENKQISKVKSFVITIACMNIMNDQHSNAVFQWLSTLPYPWVERTELFHSMPEIDELKPIKAILMLQKSN